MPGGDWAYQIFVCGLIGFPWLTGQLFVIWPWWEWRLTEHVLWLTVFNLMVGMTYWNYYLACTTDPGVYSEDLDTHWEKVTNTLDVKSLDNVMEPAERSSETHTLLPVSIAATGPFPLHLRSSPSSVSHAVVSGLSTQTPSQVFQRTCHKCKQFKPSRTHHCSVCKRCIRKSTFICDNCSNIQWTIIARGLITAWGTLTTATF